MNDSDKEWYGMKKAAWALDEYDKWNMTEKVSFLCEHYYKMERLISDYRDELIAEVLEQKEFSRRGSDEGIGVRIMVSFGRKTDTTSGMAMKRVEVSEAIDRGLLDESFFEGVDNPEEVIRKVIVYHVVNEGFKTFSRRLEELKPSDREIIIPYLRREKRLCDLANDLNIEYHSAVRKIIRMKKRLEKEMGDCVVSVEGGI